MLFKKATKIDLLFHMTQINLFFFPNPNESQFDVHVEVVTLIMDTLTQKKCRKKNIIKKNESLIHIGHG